MSGRDFPANAPSSDPDEGWFDLTMPQLDFWEEFSLHPEEPFSTVAHYLELQGPMNLGAFMSAVNRVIKESDVFSLRFRIDPGTGVPCQRMEVDAIPEAELVDLQAEEDPFGTAMQWMRKDVEAPLNLLERGITSQVVFRLDAEHHLWYLRTHHILVDGYAMSLLARRAGRLYASSIGGTPEGEGFLPFMTFIREERSYLGSGRFMKDQAFWRSYLAEGVTLPVLDKGTEEYGGGGLHFKTALPASFQTRLRDISDRLTIGWPDFLTLLSSLYVHEAVNRTHAKRDDSVVWVPFMSRWGSVAMNVPALVVNILPLRVATDWGVGIRQYLDEGAKALCLHRKHGRYRVEQMAADRGVPENRRFFFSPLVNVLPFEEACFGRLRCRRHVLAAGPGDGFNVTFRGDLASGGLSLEMDADDALMSKGDFEGHCIGLPSFLEACVEAAGHGEGVLGDCLKRAGIRS